MSNIFAQVEMVVQASLVVYQEKKETTFVGNLERMAKEERGCSNERQTG